MIAPDDASICHEINLRRESEKTLTHKLCNFTFVITKGGDSRIMAKKAAKKAAKKTTKKTTKKK